MIALNAVRRKVLESAINKVLAPAQRTMVRELLGAGGSEPKPEEMLHWIRLNMPTASERIEELLYRGND